MVCDCIEHKSKGSDCTHITTELETLKKAGQGFRIMERAKFNLCKFCNSGNIYKKGTRKTKQGRVQKYQCRDCQKSFTANPGFEKMRYAPILITRSLQMYFTGMSVRDIADQFEQEEIKVSYRTVYNWIDKYSKMTSIYLNGIIPKVGNWFRADEVWVKINGEKHYLFASMDDDTRFWLASEMASDKFGHRADNIFQMTKQQAGKSPRILITDKLPAYRKAAKRVFGKDTWHKADAGIRSKRPGVNGKITVKTFHPSNNKMERLNGEIRDREKVFRGLKKEDTSVIDGMRTYYNFTKKHSGIGGKTPTEQAGIIVEGSNKWKTIIQNASLNQIKN